MAKPTKKSAAKAALDRATGGGKPASVRDVQEQSKREGMGMSRYVRPKHGGTNSGMYRDVMDQTREQISGENRRRGIPRYTRPASQKSALNDQTSGLGHARKSVKQTK